MNWITFEHKVYAAVFSAFGIATFIAYIATH